MDRGTWQATVRRIAELDTTERLTHTHTHTNIFVFVPMASLAARHLLFFSFLYTDYRVDGTHGEFPGRKGEDCWRTDSWVELRS